MAAHLSGGNRAFPTFVQFRGLSCSAPDSDCYFFSAFACIVMDIFSMTTRSSGTLFSRPERSIFVGTLPIFFRTSSPAISFPNAVYFPSRNVASPRQMKNCEPAELGSLLRAIEMTPTTCLLVLNSAAI